MEESTASGEFAGQDDSVQPQPKELGQIAIECSAEEQRVTDESPEAKPPVKIKFARKYYRHRVVYKVRLAKESAEIIDVG